MSLQRPTGKRSDKLIKSNKERTNQIGIGLGIVVILTRLVAAPSVLASPEAMLSYGLFTGFLFSITLFFAIILFSYSGKRIKNQSAGYRTIGDFLKVKLLPIDYKIFISLILLLSVQGLLIQVTVIDSLLNLILDVPYHTLFILIYFIFMFVMVTRLRSLVNLLAQWQISLIFAVVILVPVYLLIQQGIEPVYKGIRLYHPYLLVMFRDDSFLFVSIGILIGFGYIFLNPTIWQRLYQLKSQKVRRTFMLSAFIWCVMPISLVSIFFLIIYHGGFKNFADIPLVIIQSGTPVLLFLLFLGVSTALTATFVSELHAIITLFQKNVIVAYQLPKQKQLKYGWLAVSSIVLLTFALHFFYQPSFLEIYYLGGVIHVSLLPRMIMLIFLHHRGEEGMAGPLLGILFGYMIFIMFNPLIGIASAFIISSSITLSFKFQNKWKRNHAHNLK